MEVLFLPGLSQRETPPTVLQKARTRSLFCPGGTSSTTVHPSQGYFLLPLFLLLAFLLLPFPLLAAPSSPKGTSPKDDTSPKGDSSPKDDTSPKGTSPRGNTSSKGGSPAAPAASRPTPPASRRLPSPHPAVLRLQGQLQQMRQHLKKVQQRLEEMELEKLRNEGLTESSTEKEKKEETVFRSGQRSLQLLNPEISVTVDTLLQGILDNWAYNARDPAQRSGFFFRMAGLHFQANLDPFSLTKMAFALTPKGLKIGEVYMTWTNLFPSVSLTLGKFRQRFGVVNRWHLPSLDQSFFPLALTKIFGPGGLNQTGLSLHWLMPSLWAHTNELFLQITNGENEKVFSGSFFSLPSFLLKLKSYYDLTHSLYLEFGLTGMFGLNNKVGEPQKNEQGQVKVVDEDLRTTVLAAADLTFKWNPLQQQRYQELTWRSEFYYGRKETLPSQVEQTLGGYSYLQYKFNESWILGLRFDLVHPFAAVFSEKNLLWQLDPYVTFWQSPWVKLRFSYIFQMAPDSTLSHSLYLQFVWSAGPHKHERY